MVLEDEETSAPEITRCDSVEMLLMDSIARTWFYVARPSTCFVVCEDNRDDFGSYRSRDPTAIASDRSGARSGQFSPRLAWWYQYKDCAELSGTKVTIRLVRCADTLSCVRGVAYG